MLCGEERQVTQTLLSSFEQKTRTEGNSTLLPNAAKVRRKIQIKTEEFNLMLDVHPSCHEIIARVNGKLEQLKKDVV